MIPLTKRVTETGETFDVDSDIVEHHVHPVRSFDTPTGRYRMASIQFLAFAVGDTVLAGGGAGITYTIVAALGAPGAGNVEVLVQGTADLTVRKFAEAMRGVTDALNIAYGAGTQPNPDIWGYYTSQRWSLEASPVTAGSNVIFVETVPDRTDTGNPLVLVATVAGLGVTQVPALPGGGVIRTYTTRYLMTGNAAALGNRVAGAYQTVIPMCSVMDDNGREVWYDPCIFVSEAVSLTTIVIECDTYWSDDEVTFHLMGMGLDVSKELITTGAGQFQMGLQRVPPGAGVYVKFRSSGTVTTDWIDFKFHSHYYPFGL